MVSIPVGVCVVCSNGDYPLYIYIRAICKRKTRRKKNIRRWWRNANNIVGKYESSCVSLPISPMNFVLHWRWYGPCNRILSMPGPIVCEEIYTAYTTECRTPEWPDSKALSSLGGSKPVINLSSDRAALDHRYSAWYKRLVQRLGESKNIQFSKGWGSLIWNSDRDSCIYHFV